MSKLVTTIVYIVIVISFTSQNVSGLIPFVFYPVIMMSLSGTPYRTLFKRLLIALPFSLMGGISNLILVRATAFNIGNIAISIGMVSFASIMLKTLLTVFAVLILIATTSLVEISGQLAALRVPKILCLQFVMTYRYLSVLLGEAVTMYTAYSLRSPAQKGIKMKDMGSFLGFLIIRSFDRAERVYQSMKCRGFKNIYYGRKHDILSMSDWLFTIITVSAVVVLRIVNLSVFLVRHIPIN